MSDIVERLRRIAKELPQTSGNQAWLRPEDTTAWEAADEIERLRAGGCARDQTTTQYCAEAVALQSENARLHDAVHDLAKHVWRGDFDKLQPETRTLLGEKL
jgi:hypothetical protein